MKIIKVTLSILVAFLLLSAFSLKKEKKEVYIFGLSASFTDSVVYYTNIQPLDSVYLEKSFLPNREVYSNQLKDYLEFQQGQKDRTCMVYFSNKKKSLEKQYIKILNKYKKDKSVRLQAITPEDFAFRKPEY